MAIGNYLENAILSHITNQTIYAPPGILYVALYTSDPTDYNTGNEVIAPEYARQEIVFSAPIDGKISNTNNVLFSPATTLWGVITHTAIFDQSTGGNMLFYGALETSSTINISDQAVFYANDISFTLD